MHFVYEGGGCAGDGTRMEAAERQHSSGGLPAGGVPVEPGQVPGRGSTLLQGHRGGKHHLCLAVFPQDPRLWCAASPFSAKFCCSIPSPGSSVATSPSACSSCCCSKEPSDASVGKPLPAFCSGETHTMQFWMGAMQLWCNLRTLSDKKRR